MIRSARRPAKKSGYSLARSRRGLKQAEISVDLRDDRGLKYAVNNIVSLAVRMGDEALLFAAFVPRRVTRKHPPRPNARAPSGRRGRADDRAPPPSNRCGRSIDFLHGNLGFTMSAGFYPDGRIGEIFISSHKPGTAVEAVARDAAIATSIALQFGADIETIRNALTKDHAGGPATLLGAALDLLAEAGQ